MMYDALFVMPDGHIDRGQVRSDVTHLRWPMRNPLDHPRGFSAISLVRSDCTTFNSTPVYVPEGYVIRRKRYPYTIAQSVIKSAPLRDYREWTLQLNRITAEIRAEIPGAVVIDSLVVQEIHLRSVDARVGVMDVLFAFHLLEQVRWRLNNA